MIVFAWPFDARAKIALVAYTVTGYDAGNASAKVGSHSSK